MIDKAKLGRWRFTGTAAIAVLWLSLGLGAYLARLPLLGHHPISSLGVNPASATLFSGGLIVTAGLFLIFLVYLNNRFTVSPSFKLVFTVGQLAQIVAALVPFGGRFRVPHSIAAFVLVFSLPILIWRFASAQPEPSFRRLAWRLFWLELAAFCIGLFTFIFIGRASPIAQALPAIAFHIWVVVLTVRSGATANHTSL